jgi:hypothetical protein
MNSRKNITALFALISASFPHYAMTSEKGPDCMDIIIMEALLAAAVEACPLKWVNRNLSEMAAKCLPSMDERVSDALARQGVSRFIEEEKSQGKPQVCASLVEDFPLVVKKY